MSLFPLQFSLNQYNISHRDKAISAIENPDERESVVNMLNSRPVLLQQETRKRFAEIDAVQQQRRQSITMELPFPSIIVQKDSSSTINTIIDSIAFHIIVSDDRQLKFFVNNIRIGSSPTERQQNMLKYILQQNGINGEVANILLLTACIGICFSIVFKNENIKIPTFFSVEKINALYGTMCSTQNFTNISSMKSGKYANVNLCSLLITIIVNWAPTHVPIFTSPQPVSGAMYANMNQSNPIYQRVPDMPTTSNQQMATISNQQMPAQPINNQPMPTISNQQMPTISNQQMPAINNRQMYANGQQAMQTMNTMATNDNMTIDEMTSDINQLTYELEQSHISTPSWVRVVKQTKSK